MPSYFIFPPNLLHPYLPVSSPRYPGLKRPYPCYLSLLVPLPSSYQTFGSYQSYIADKQDAMQMERKNEKLKLKYMKLRNINIIVTILLIFLSFIAGILLSDQVKKLLQ